MIYSREHAFAFVLHLMGEFFEHKYRGFETGSYFGAAIGAREPERKRR
jgi:hypothetical protein